MAVSETLQATHTNGSRGAIAALQVLVGVSTPLALISIGGLGIYAAPILLPLLWITANACRGSGRWYFTVLGALLAALSTWAIAWGIAPGLQLLLPLVAATAVVVLFIKTWHRDLALTNIAIVLFALGALGLAGIGSLAAGDEATTTREVNIERVPKK